MDTDNREGAQPLVVWKGWLPSDAVVRGENLAAITEDALTRRALAGGPPVRRLDVHLRARSIDTLVAVLEQAVQDVGGRLVADDGFPRAVEASLRAKRSAHTGSLTFLVPDGTEGDTGCLHLSPNDNHTAYVRLVGGPESLYAFLRKLSDRAVRTRARKERGGLQLLLQTPEGIQTVVAGYVAQALEPRNYPDDVVAGLDTIAQALSAKRPPGRLAVIAGPSGTGKTHLVKALMHRLDRVRWVFVSSDIIRNLTGPIIGGVLMDMAEHQRRFAQRTVLVVEDADDVLAPREAGGRADMAGLATVLNITDGIPGDAFDIRVLATTNAKVISLDPALCRPGRLIQVGGGVLVVPYLSGTHANAVLSRLLGREESVWTDADTTSIAAVYQVAGSRGWTPPTQAAGPTPQPAESQTSTFAQVERIRARLV